MSFLLHCISIFLGSLLLHFIFPSLWWAPVIPALLAGFYFQLPNWKSFFSAFISVGLLWFILIFWMSSQNNHQLLDMMKTILPFGSRSTTFITVSLLGAILGGLASWHGKLIKDLIFGEANSKKTKKRRKYS